MYTSYEQAIRQAQANADVMQEAYMVFFDTNGNLRVELDNPKARHDKTVVQPTQAVKQAPRATFYDYDNQAWVVDGRYKRCGHLTDCGCYGKLHEGKRPSDRIIQEYGS